MIKLKIKDSSEIELEKTNAICNFCGQRNEFCIRGSLPSTFTANNYKLEYEKVPKNSEYCRKEGKLSESVFGRPKLLEDGPYGYFYRDYEYKYVVKESNYKDEKEEVDICKDCIKQLSKLIK